MKKLSEELSDKSKWCQGALYKTAQGLTTIPQRAERCCLLGGMNLCNLDSVIDKIKMVKAIKAVSPFMDTSGSLDLIITTFNDDSYRSFEDIQQVIAEFEKGA